MSIKVTIRTVYGTEKIYPACDKSQTFAAMLGQTTLTRRDIAHIKALGFAIEVQQPAVTL